MQYREKDIDCGKREKEGEAKGINQRSYLKLGRDTRMRGSKFDR